MAQECSLDPKGRKVKISVCSVPRDSVYEKMLSNLQKIQAQGGPAIAIGTEADEDIVQHCDDLIQVPASSEIFTPLLNVVRLQLLAYHLAR